MTVDIPVLQPSSGTNWRLDGFREHVKSLLCRSICPKIWKWTGHILKFWCSCSTFWFQLFLHTNRWKCLSISIFSKASRSSGSPLFDIGTYSNLFSDWMKDHLIKLYFLQCLFDSISWHQASMIWEKRWILRSIYPQRMNFGLFKYTIAVNGVRYYLLLLFEDIKVFKMIWCDKHRWYDEILKQSEDILENRG